jgi:hypothetical protein
VANLVYNKGKYVAAGFPLAATSEVLTLMLVTTGYTANQDHNLVDDGTTDDPKSYEISVGGYSRQSLANKVRFEDDTNDFAGIDADNVTFSSLAAGGTIGAGVLYRYSSSGTTSDTGQELVGYYEVTATPTNGGDITIAWASTSAGGVLKYGTTS